jgi:hypothetical protein
MQKMGNTPFPVDLEELWKQLGIERRGQTVLFHDDAPRRSPSGDHARAIILLSMNPAAGPERIIAGDPFDLRNEMSGSPGII